MSENNGKLILITCIAISSVIFSGCTGSSFEKQRITGQVDIDSLEKLFSRYDLTLKTGLEKVSIHSLDGTEIASDENATRTGSFSFQVPSGSAYFLKAQTADGVNLWAITPVISNDTVQDIGLDTTYEASLIVASLGKPPSSNVNDLKRKAAEALELDFDRLVKTVKRVVNNAVLKKVDYSPVTEVSKETLRAFAGGMEPVRSLDSVLNKPESDSIPFIYAGRYVSPSEPNNILITEIDGKRWDYRVQGMSRMMKYPETPEGQVERISNEKSPHVTNGGSTLVFTSTRTCLEEPYPCPYKYLEDQNELRTYAISAIYSIPLDAPPDTKPEQLTSGDTKFRALNPKLSWDEKKIVFDAGPMRKVDWIDEKQIPEQAAEQIYVMNKDGTGITQLTFDKDLDTWNLYPAWSPDNKQIVYTSDRTGDYELWIMNSDGSENTQLTNYPDSNEGGPQFSPDGRQIIFYSDRDGDSEIFVMDRDGTNVKQLTYNNVLDKDPSWAHNGIDIVYTSKDYVVKGILKGTEGKLVIKMSRLVTLNTLTGKRLYDFGDFAVANAYEAPVWAATDLILVPSKEAIKLREFTTQGYVTDQGGSSRISSANPSVQSAYEIKKIPSGWCQEVGQGCDASAFASRQLGIAGVNYVSPSVEWVPTTYN